MLVNQLIPTGQLQKVGPVAFLAHLYPISMERGVPPPRPGIYAHPHRGIATMSYVLGGELQYRDSRGHRRTLGAGGLHWMNAGSGIVHEERPGIRLYTEGGVFHGVQFWIVLPAAQKQSEPEYTALLKHDVPEATLPDHAGVLRILLGRCGEVRARIKSFLDEFVFHIRLNPKSAFSHSTRPGLEYGVFVPVEEIRVNGKLVGNSCVLCFAIDGQHIELYNPGVAAADVFVFGGAAYREPIVAEGPFVMNTRAEIAVAYRDFFAGRYGELKTEG